ncbi:MAG: LysM peptidoglycan-binding domain-containing protein [Anaerostipes sp.]|nr:LysM peptidoglycan-binding domain-containing protein [Anaerostipes sp.]MDD3746067.1 LysM peptidoglycan-binding domain-containing protein [Anaerostipes sp.]
MRIYKCRIKLFLFGVVVMLFIAGGLFIHGNSVVGADSAKKKCFKSVQIQDGDTLWSIAKKHITDEYSTVNDYVEEVCEANHIGADDITEGMYIVIPYYAAKA